MTSGICDHHEDGEWQDKEITEDGTVQKYYCHECDREVLYERDHTLTEAMEVLNVHLRSIGNTLQTEVLQWDAISWAGFALFILFAGVAVERYRLLGIVIVVLAEIIWISVGKVRRNWGM